MGWWREKNQRKEISYCEKEKYKRNKVFPPHIRCVSLHSHPNLFSWSLFSSFQCRDDTHTRYVACVGRQLRRGSDTWWIISMGNIRFIRRRKRLDLRNKSFDTKSTRNSQSSVKWRKIFLVFLFLYLAKLHTTTLSAVHVVRSTPRSPPKTSSALTPLMVEIVH